MKLSCKMLTHGRVHLIIESVYSFLIQEFDEESELIVVNDCPDQKLIFDHPKVKIYNLDKTFPIIGEKENFAIEKCSGDIIVTFDDDDIALPNHFQNIKKYFNEDTNLLHWARGVYYNEPNITNISSVGNSGIVYTKKAWEEIGKSPIENAGGDMTLVGKLTKLDPNKVIYAHPNDQEVSWFYRWSLPYCYHQSGMGTDTPDRENIVIRNSNYVKEQIRKGIFPKGDIKLVPKWRYDYVKMLKDYVTNNKL